MKYKVCVDPGHGGTDPGAVNGALYEKDVVLDICIRLGKLLEKAGYDVRLTRENDRFDTPLMKSKMANEFEADVFVSVHCNAAAMEQAHGTETLTFDEDGKSGYLGKCIQRRLIDELGLSDRGLKTRKELTVLNRTKMPAALVEVAFISNPGEKLLLIRPEFRAKAADAIFAGIEEYFGRMKKMTVEEAKSIVKERYGFDENTMKYFELYRFGDELIKRLAEKAER